MTDSHWEERDVQIARFRTLAQEVCDPFTVCLLRVILEELEGKSGLNDKVSSSLNARACSSLCCGTSLAQS